MQQDFYQQNKSTFAPLMEACDGVPLPIALVDTQLTQFWENQYLKTNFPFLCSKDNVLSLLQGYDIDALIASLHTQNGALSFPSRLPMAHTVLSFSPLFDQNEVFVGATVHFSVNTTQMFPSDTNGAQEMLQNFNTTLRDPLSSIFSNISTIERRLEIDDVYSCEALVKKLSADCYHMLKSCNSLSEYTAYANGLACLNLRLVSLNQYLDDLLRHLQMIVRRTGVRLEYTLPDESVELYLDTDKLVIVLTSLISNCIAFADPDREEKHIRIEVTASRRSVRFVVADNGLGIPPETLPHVFEPYFTSGRQDLQFTHLGLGLTLCKLIVNHHGGDISVISTEKCTRVTFTLSRELSDDHPGQITFCDNPVEYITNSYSPMYIYLSDVCEWSIL